MTFCLSPSLSSLVHYQRRMINRVITKCHVIISYYFLYHLLSHTMYLVPYYSLYSSVCICDNVIPVQRLSALMGWKPEVIYLTGERLSCPHAMFNVKLIWRQNLRSVGFDLCYVIRFFGRFCLLPSLSSLDHYQPSSFSSRADNGLPGW